MKIPTLNRRNFLKTAGLGIAGFVVSPLVQSCSKQNHSPNIIFIMADDLGYGDLGCYGQKHIKTPNIDALAMQGKRFTQFYAGSTVCAPSRCSLLTGKHTGHAFVRGNHEIGSWESWQGQLPLPEGTRTIASMLKKQGYATACIGKWGLGRAGSSGDPNRQGFDLFFGYNCQRHAHNYYPRYLERNNEKIYLEGNDRGKTGMHYSHDLLTDEALKFIETNKDQKFFLYLPYTIPHTKFQVPELGEYENKDWKPNHKIQAAMISRMDRDIGRIMQLLEELKIDRNTIVIFTSDNGPHGDGGTLQFFNAAGPLRGRKRDLYEGGIRTPFIVRWPGKVALGTTSDHIAAFWDVLPTFADFTKTSAPADCDGISFLPELLGEAQKKHDYLYWEFYEAGGKQAVRKGDWKAVRLNVHEDAGSPLELYNLKEDISEHDNVAGKFPEIAEQLKAIMQKAHTKSEYFTFGKK